VAPSIRDSDKPASAPAQIGNYLILDEIARGGMGVVYRARQLGLNRIVALKMTLTGQFAGDGERARFQAEAEAAGQLDHPHIVPIYEVGEYGGQPYFSMGFVEGQSLKGLIADGPLPARQAAEIVKTVSEAVHYAHTKGIVHRDLKPANVLIDIGGQPRVTDFGLAKQATTDSGLTATGQVLGTPSFMPPEQAMGHMDEVGPRSDVYSLGATLYSLLTGRPPFQAASVLETLLQVNEKEPVPPRTLNPETPRDLETVCLKCLEKQPARRYDSAVELAEDLNRYLNDEPVVARPVGGIEQAWRWCRRKPLAAGLLAATAVVVLLSFVGLWYRSQFAAAATRLEAAETVQKVSQYHSSINRVREAIASPEHGWTWEAEKELRNAAKNAPDDADPHELRTLLAETLSRHDVRRVGTVSKGTAAGAVAFSPDGLKLAVAQRKHALSCSVTIYSVERFEPIATYSFSTAGGSLGMLLKGKANYQDGARSVTWSPDGRWLVVGTRFGHLVRWDTTATNPQGVGWKGHDTEIRQLRFSADGSILYSNAEQLKLWKANGDWSSDGMPSLPAQRFTLPPGGERLVVELKESYAIQVFDPVTLADLKAWPANARMALISCSSDGRFVAGQSENVHEMIVRDAQTGQAVVSWPLRFEDEPVVLSSFLSAPDSSAWIGQDLERRIHFWDPATGRSLMSPLSSGEGSCFDIDPRRGWIALADADDSPMVSIYEWRSPTAAAPVLAVGQVRGFDFAPKSERLAMVTATESIGLDGTDSRWIELSEWNLDTLSVTQTRRARHDRRWQPLPPSTAAWHPTGNRIAWFADWCGMMVTAASGSTWQTQIAPYPGAAAPIAIPAEAFTWKEQSARAALEGESESTRRPIAMTHFKAGESPGRLALKLSDLPLDRHREGWMLVASLRASREGRAVAAFEVGIVNPDLADGGRRTVAQAVDSLRNGQPNFFGLGLIDSHDDGRDARFGIAGVLPEPKSAEMTLGIDEAFLVPLAIHRSEQSAGGSRPFEHGPVAWSPDGQRLYGLVEGQKRVAAWNADDLRIVAHWSSPIDEVTTGVSQVYALAAGNRRVVCGSRNGIVSVLKVGEGKLTPETRFPGPGGVVRAVAVDPTESWTVVGTQTGKVELRELPSGQLLADVPGHRSAVQSVALAQGGKLLATTGDEGVVRLFVVKNGTSIEPWLTLRGRSGGLMQVRVSENGRYVAATPRNSRSILLWDLSEVRQQSDRLLLQAQAIPQGEN
jgi:WD40 repeat protein